MKENKKIDILVCHHKESPYIENKYIRPIQVGRKNSKKILDYCIGDDTGDNISEKNKSWCELTALYWQWKNVEASWYGLFHYRRYLSFKEEGDFTYELSNIEEIINNGYISEQKIYDMCKDSDVITGPVWNVNPVGLNWQVMTSYELYCRDHYKKDIDLILNIVKKDFSKYYFPLLESLYSTKSFFFNIMILRKELFQEYCAFLFGVLEKAEMETDISKYPQYQQRIWGFIGERLANAYFYYLDKKYPNLKKKQLPLVFLDLFTPRKMILDTTEKQKENGDSIKICLSFDDNYCKHASACIKSILDNTTNTNIDFYILSDDKLSYENRKKIKKNFNSKFIFIDIDKSIFSNFPLNREHISINTYYRLAIQDLLSSCQKIIYIDSDALVLGDINELWNYDISQNYIAGCLDEGGLLQSRRLNLGDDNNYINAGVIVFNLNNIRKDFNSIIETYLENFIKNNRIISLQDQDIINITFKNNIKILPIRWNMNSRLFTPNFLDHKYSEDSVNDAFSNPGILHYTDRKKPWTMICQHPYAYLYWQYRKKIKAIFPISFKDKFIIFIQKNIDYRIIGNKVLFEIHFLHLKLSKNFVKKIYGYLK